MAFGRSHALFLASFLFLFSTTVLILSSFYSSGQTPLVDLSAIRHSLSSLANLTSHQNAYQLDPHPEQGPYGAVVIARQDDTDLTWTDKVAPDWTMFPYNVYEPHSQDTRLGFPVAKGHEAMIYLSFIIDNYDALPWAVVFTHGHQEAWHQEDTIDRLLNDLQLSALARAGYINLRCDWFPSCPAELRPTKHDAMIWGPGTYHEQSEAAIARHWRDLFPGDKLPATIASQCCAQFAVTRQAILRRPISDYERMRNWLIDTALADDISGRVFEKLWAYMFTGNAVNCPPPQKCACQYFGRCEPHEWTEVPKGISIPNWP